MADYINPQSNLAGYKSLSWGALMSSQAKAHKLVKDMNPDHNWGLGVAKVMNVNYVEQFLTLRTLIGVSQTFDRIPIPMTYPGAGKRHFLGAMPEIGDVCIVGWMPSESSSSESTRIPVVLSWVIPGVWPGLDWVTVSDFDPDEYDINNPKDQHQLRGVYSQVRHKLRHIQPGNIVASSSQGSDLVLDEGVILANRRGNEIRLRDQDQALVTRSLQQFNAMAGARVYAGMVQRDARLLPAMCVSDGDEWDSKTQAIAGQAIDSSSLDPDPIAPNEGFYTPSKLFQRRQLSMGDGSIAGQPFNVSPYLDPYNFLQKGGILDDAGYVQDVGATDSVSDVVYGGKPIYRVALQTDKNAAAQPDTPTLTEYRIEVNHTSDGRLPVTEQTDMFDADRLLDTNPEIAQTSKVPFIEWVMGSVVGNDPYTQKGQQKYGLPIVPVVFEDDKPVPSLKAAHITSEGGGDLSTPLKDQAAMLFSMTPPIEQAAAPTFWSVNKQGQFRGYIGGDKKNDSVHLYAQGNMKIGTGGYLDLLLQKGIRFKTSGQSNIDFSADDGVVRIFGGGRPKNVEAALERLSGTGGGEGDLPSVDLESATNMRLRAEKKIFLKSNDHETQATNVNITGHERIAINGTKTVSVTTENYHMTCSAQASELYNGPKYMLPTNFPLHERVYVSAYPGFTGEKVSYQMCDREEEFKVLGSHKTTMQIGDMTYETQLGTWTAKCTSNTLEVDSMSGIKGKTNVGDVSFKAVSGNINMSGMASAMLESVAGVATLKGGSLVKLSAPVTGPDQGPILCGGSLEPFTNLPFSTWGIGAKMHQVTS